MELKKKDPSICSLQERHFRFKDTNKLKIKGWKNIYYANSNQKKARVSILISKKIVFILRPFKVKEKHEIPRPLIASLQGSGLESKEHLPPITTS